MGNRCVESCLLLWAALTGIAACRSDNVTVTNHTTVPAACPPLNCSLPAAEHILALIDEMKKLNWFLKQALDIDSNDSTKEFTNETPQTSGLRSFPFSKSTIVTPAAVAHAHEPHDSGVTRPRSGIVTRAVLHGLDNFVYNHTILFIVLLVIGMVLLLLVLFFTLAALIDAMLERDLRGRLQLAGRIIIVFLAGGVVADVFLHRCS
ncbi:uncharacterized protein LOC129581132 [Paramacrobiotus metropolitanus]|uniref:uncharacterized protein LOC129581132 n=1 Tax=Paramacrobiotus metropolitanus TaxID=2943436 RepID=UPI002446251C|nr:uncharacterized protein LOC129581132 [Paramacrobiotus metropolitanus]